MWEEAIVRIAILQKNCNCENCYNCENCNCANYVSRNKVISWICFINIQKENHEVLHNCEALISFRKYKHFNLKISNCSFYRKNRWYQKSVSQCVILKKWMVVSRIDLTIWNINVVNYEKNHFSHDSIPVKVDNNCVRFVK